MQINPISFRPQQTMFLKSAKQKTRQVLSTSTDIVSFSGNSRLESLSEREILEQVMGIKVLEEDENGMFTINHYKMPQNYNSIGINENKLFEKIKCIRGDASFEYSNVTNLGNLEIIEKNVDFSCSKVENTGKLRKINGDANFKNCPLTSTYNIEEIGGNCDFERSKISMLPKLKKIGGELNVEFCPLTSTYSIEEIGGFCEIADSNISDLPNLKTVGGISFGYATIDSGALEDIKGNCHLYGQCRLVFIDNIKHIGGKIYATHDYNRKIPKILLKKLSKFARIKQNVDSGCDPDE